MGWEKAHGQVERGGQRAAAEIGAPGKGPARLTAARLPPPALPSCTIHVSWHGYWRGCICAPLRRSMHLKAPPAADCDCGRMAGRMDRRPDSKLLQKRRVVTTTTTNSKINLSNYNHEQLFKALMKILARIALTTVKSSNRISYSNSMLQ